MAVAVALISPQPGVVFAPRLTNGRNAVLMNPPRFLRQCLLLIFDPVAIVAIVLALSHSSFAFEFAFCRVFIISLANTSALAAGDLELPFSPLPTIVGHLSMLV